MPYFMHGHRATVQLGAYHWPLRAMLPRKSKPLSHANKQDVSVKVPTCCASAFNKDSVEYFVCVCVCVQVRLCVECLQMVQFLRNARLLCAKLEQPRLLFGLAHVRWYGATHPLCVRWPTKPAWELHSKWTCDVRQNGGKLYVSKYNKFCGQIVVNFTVKNHINRVKFFPPFWNFPIIFLCYWVP